MFWTYYKMAVSAAASSSGSKVLKVALPPCTVRYVHCDLECAAFPRLVSVMRIVNSETLRRGLTALFFHLRIHAVTLTNLLHFNVCTWVIASSVAASVCPRNTCSDHKSLLSFLT